MILLQYTNGYKETFWFVALDEPWPHDSEKWSIAATTSDRAKATRFATEEEAYAVLHKAGAPTGWKIVTLPDQPESPPTPVSPS